MKKSKFSRICKIMLAALVLAGVLPAIAAESGQINYQARLLDAYGRRVNSTVDLSFKIYDAATDGTLLWSETQAGVVVQDGVYSVILGSQTPIPASVFGSASAYLELGIAGETMLPRQQITASAYSLVARTIMGSNVYENQASGNVGIGTMAPASKLDVNGTVQATGLKMTTGATAGYVLVSDEGGAGQWQAISTVITEADPIHTNWVKVVFAPATNDIWNAIGLRAKQSDVSAATNDLWGAVNARVLAATYSAATGDIWNAIGVRALQSDVSAATNDMWNNAARGIDARLLRSGDQMTGYLTNLVGFVGNGAGLTNISSGGISLTSVVHKVGDTMTGPLVISNNLTVTGKTIYTPSAYTTVAVDTVISPDQAIKMITSDADVVMTASQPIAAGTDGQMITLIYRGVHSVVLTNNPGSLYLDENVSFTMSDNDIIQFVYSAIGFWSEVHRADNAVFIP